MPQNLVENTDVSEESSATGFKK